jgi:hypothetical protein
MIESAFNFTYFDQMGIEARFDLASIEALHRDFSDKVETAGKLVKIGFTPNEVNQRLELGFEDADWRDYIWKPSSERAIGEDAPAVLEERPDEPIVIEPPEEPELLPAPEEEEIVIAKLELKPDFQQRGERIWKDMVKQARPIEKIFRSKTRKMFFQWRNLVLNWFYEQAEKSLKDSDKPFIMNRPLTDINELSIQPFDDLKAAADVLYEKTLMTGLETIALEIGEVLDIDILSLADAQAFLLDKGIDLKGLVETQAKQLRASLSIGMEKGESLDELAARIRWKFKNAANRALTIARTEVYGSLNFGRNTTIKETKYRKVQWFTSMDEKVRKTHARMHAKKKGIRESWIVGGSSLRYPGDPMGAAGEIINCRCIEVVALGSLSDN